MKKAEAKTDSKAKKTTNAAKAVKSSNATKGETVRTRKVTAKKSGPTDEEISRKAYEIYSERVSRGEHGTQADDWHKAMELLKKG
jgi:hypothetical protein